MKWLQIKTAVIPRRNTIIYGHNMHTLCFPVLPAWKSKIIIIITVVRGNYK